MKRLRRWWACLLFAAGLCFAQAPLVPGLHDTDNRYEAIHTGASGGETVTVQQPANPGFSVQFEVAVVYCAAACTIKLSQNGTGATSTTLATTPLNGAPLSTATAWSASNVSGGTSLYTYTLAAAGTVTLDLSKFILGKGNGINQNFSLTISGSMSTPQTMIQWVER